MRPLHGDVTVIVALLVSTSMRSWSAMTLSPGWTRKLMMAASAMDSPSCGMMMGMEGILKSSKFQAPISNEAPTLKLQNPLPARTAPRLQAWCLKFLWSLELGVWWFHLLSSQNFSRSRSDGAGRRTMRHPKVRMIRHGGILGIQPLRRHPAPRPRFPNAEQAPGARHAGDDGVGIQRFHRPQIHHFNFPALGGKFRRRFQRFVNHGAVGHHGQVAAFAGDPGLADGQGFARQFLGL